MIFNIKRIKRSCAVTAKFTWREPLRVSISLTVQYDKVLYLIEDNELSRRAIGKYIEVWHLPISTVYSMNTIYMELCDSCNLSIIALQFGIVYSLPRTSTITIS